MTLALTTGWVDVDAMLASMTAAQWQEWRAFARVEPFGPHRDGIHAALIAHTVHATAGGTATMSQFMPTFKTRAERLAESAAKFRAWCDAREERLNRRESRQDVGNSVIERGPVPTVDATDANRHRGDD